MHTFKVVSKRLAFWFTSRLAALKITSGSSVQAGRRGYTESRNSAASIAEMIRVAARTRLTFMP